MRYRRFCSDRTAEDFSEGGERIEREHGVFFDR
jgi:hypothetical protein